MMNNSFWFWSLRWSCVRYRVDVECKYYCNFKWKIVWRVIVSMLWGLCEDMNMKWLTALTKTQQTIELAYTNELWSKSNLLWYHYGSDILSRLNGDVHELLCGNLCVFSSSVYQEKWRKTICSKSENSLRFHCIFTTISRHTKRPNDCCEFRKLNSTSYFCTRVRELCFLFSHVSPLTPPRPT